MTDSPADPTPATAPAPLSLWRQLHLGQWLLIALLASCAYGARRKYDFRQAITKAKALECEWKYDDRIDAIRKNCRSAFGASTRRDNKRDPGITALPALFATRFGILAGCVYGAWREYDFREAIKEAKALRWRWTYDDPFEVIRKDWRAAFRVATWRDGKRAVWIDAWNDQPEYRRLLHRLAPRALDIYHCREFCDLSLFAGLSGLRRLSLSDCMKLENIDAISSLRDLRELTLASCPQLASVEALRELPELEVLHLSRCLRLTNADALASLPKLKELRLRCEALTELPELGGLKELKFLDLDNCISLRNLNGLKSLPALRNLYFAVCTGLTNVDAIKSLKSLQLVHFNGCTGLSKEQVDKLKAALPAVEIWGR